MSTSWFAAIINLSSASTLYTVDGALEARQTAVLCQVAAVDEDVDLGSGTFGRVWPHVVGVGDDEELDGRHFVCVFAD